MLKTRYTLHNFVGQIAKTKWLILNTLSMSISKKDIRRKTGQQQPLATTGGD